MRGWRWSGCAGAALVGLLALAGCGGGGGGAASQGLQGGQAADGPPDGVEAATVGAVSLEAPQAQTDGGAPTGRLVLEWSAAEGAVRYRVEVAPRAGADFAAVEAAVSGRRAVYDPAPTWRLDWPTARVRVQACDAADACTASNPQPLATTLAASRPELVPGDPHGTWGGTRAYAIADDGLRIAALRTTDMGMFGAHWLGTDLRTSQRRCRSR